MQQERIIVLDFGGQYKQLIARRVRECNVYCEIHPHTLSIEKIREMNPKGIIMTGGPASVYDEKSPTCSPELFEMGIPVLGICYGSQLMAYRCGAAHAVDGSHGKKDAETGGASVDENAQAGYAANAEAVKTAPVSEYGRTEEMIDAPDSLLFQDVVTVNASDENAKGTVGSTICWMSHTDYIARVPEGFRITAHTANCPVAAMENPAKKLYAVQFHPEVEHTPEGKKMLRGFVMDVCGCRGDWEMSSFAERTIKELREKIGDKHVLLGLSGGVDSTVAAALLSKAIGDQLHCVFVDHGLMRKNEGDEVESIFGPKGNFDLQFIRVNAQERFFKRLIGQTDPETKRKIIGEEFPRVFGDEARKLKGKVRYLAQGTIYPDVVESGDGKTSDVIKSHHNVGGLPIELVRELGFDETPIEPLRMLFKDEVRRVGLELGVPRELVYRQPFPGPGLAVRIVGEITPYKAEIVRDADYIFREELHKAGVDENLGQYFAALSNMHSVGVMGDHRTYGLAVVLRAVITSDFMTAEAAEIPWNVLQTTMNRIINEVEGVNRVLYDITSKPPGTIELE
jgi:GMP synthase (glutamine-hydrolysing)